MEPKTYRLGTHRSATPEQTLKRLAPLLEKMGISRVANVTGLDRIGIPVYNAFRPRSRSISVSQGKGSELPAAKVSAIMESVETAIASNMPEVQENADGSVDIWLGPKAPEGKESNWIPTDTNAQFELIFRFYGPEPALFDKTWVLPDPKKIH